ncbi:hypothetical protein FPSE_11581 [Fusarium pseudograminearum CS3096]|uniref:Uncharacterized protein n=1 Tax=Fusarium pseudograminearum (strain CS3096) TaxID=1028729 RepID=K3V526_FUSPC|nr:hypothetical protein FPSE_11581 [Fusarium pseudograminearum CS3096]EKJ68242.1 hypothetical protein FPSE_11581 [Fusarium pseudograminearum CS3096]
MSKNVFSVAIIPLLPLPSSTSQLHATKIFRTKEKHIQNLNRKTKSDLVSYLTKAKRDKIDNCEWQVVWIYCHGEGRTTSGAKSPNYIAYQKNSTGQCRTQLTVRNGGVTSFLSDNRDDITIEISWDDTVPLMKNVLKRYQEMFDVLVEKTPSEQ